MVQWVKDLALSLQQLRLLLWVGFDLCPGNFHMPPVELKKIISELEDTPLSHPIMGTRSHASKVNPDEAGRGGHRVCPAECRFLRNSTATRGRSTLRKTHKEPQSSPHPMGGFARNPGVNFCRGLLCKQG